MGVSVHLLQIFLGIVLFFIINWIGRHSYSVGYMSISVFSKVEEAPAFNFLIRVLTPIVFLIISASALYALALDEYVEQFYMVNIYYLLFRLFFNLITERGLLLNWYRQLLYWVSIITLSYFSYIKLIKSKQNILPDFETIANELWIIILVFLFHVANNIRFSNEGTKRRKKNYIQKMIYEFEANYGSTINQIKNDQLKALVYSILIIENFNRPKIIRFVEYLRFFVSGKAHTLGIMQYYTETYISDIQSVQLGINKVIKKYNEEIQIYNKGEKKGYYGEWDMKRLLANSYNTGSDYQSDVLEMWEKVLKEKFPKTTDRLL